MLSAAINNTMASPMGVAPSSAVTSKTILNVGLQMQGKDQLNKQMQEWQRRMDAHKQVERSATANKLIFERNLRMMHLAAKQGMVQEQQQYVFTPNHNVVMDNTKQIMVPIFVPMHMTYQYPGHGMPSLTTPSQDQQNNPSAKLQHVSKDHDPIPHFPSPQDYVSVEDYQSSCNKWLLWHQTIPPTSSMRSDPLSEHEATDDPVSNHEATVPYDPFMLRLDYLPFTSEDDIPNIKTDSNRKASLQIDEEDEENFNVIL